jgi:hypothetical protein
MTMRGIMCECECVRGRVDAINSEGESRIREIVGRRRREGAAGLSSMTDGG